MRQKRQDTISHIEMIQTHSHSSHEAILHRLHSSHEKVELVETILDAASTTGHSIGKLLESCCQQVPVLGVMIEGIGNAVAVAKFKTELSRDEKMKLGIKVFTGFAAVGVSISAISLPHLTIALTISGLVLNLIGQVSELHTLYKEKKVLEKEYAALSTGNPQKYAEATQKIQLVRQQYAKKRDVVIEKAAKIGFSSMLLIGLTLTLANPVTAGPAAILIATSAVVYTGIKYRKQIRSMLNKVAEKAQQATRHAKKWVKTTVEKSKQQVKSLFKKTVKLQSMFYRSSEDEEALLKQLAIDSSLLLGQVC